MTEQVPKLTTYQKIKNKTSIFSQTCSCDFAGQTYPFWILLLNATWSRGNVLNPRQLALMLLTSSYQRRLQLDVTSLQNRGGEVQKKILKTWFSQFRLGNGMGMLLQKLFQTQGILPEKIPWNRSNSGYINENASTKCPTNTAAKSFEKKSFEPPPQPLYISAIKKTSILQTQI